MIKIHSLILVLLSGLFCTNHEICAQSIIPAGMERLVVLKPTGESIDGLPVVQVVADTTHLYQNVSRIFRNSFVLESIKWYFLAENYLKNKGELTAIEPAYLVLSQNDGGFAKVGFHIKGDDGLVDKSRVPYIDLVEGRIAGNQNRLMSVTQLYPHEMGHVLYGLLNRTKEDETSRSVDMHYFSIRTDYSTAFNEGFSEHIENIARITEKNDSIRNGIFSDLQRIGDKSQHAISGFRKDLLHSFRFGYYKMSMPIWYQKFEDFKRHEHGLNGTVRYQNAGLDLRNIEDQLTYRNSGVRQNTGELRNYVQMLSTEGVISTFFTRLTQSDLSEHYQEPSFYQPFISDTTTSIIDPVSLFTPLQNQFLKYFFVFHNFMTDDHNSQSQLIDFIEGYKSAFPDEEEEIESLFKEATQLEYTSSLPPDLWLLVKGHSHRLLVLDAYGALTIPFYTFDLNAAEVADLLTVKGVAEEEAGRIIDYRNSHGFFTSLEQINDIGNISDETRSRIINSRFDATVFEGLTIPDLTFTALLTAPLKSLVLRLLICYILIFGSLYLFFLRKRGLSTNQLILTALIYFIFWIFFVVAGLVFVVVSNQPWLFMLVLFVLSAGINSLIYRKNRLKIFRSLYLTALMTAIILFSVI